VQCIGAQAQRVRSVDNIAREASVAAKLVEAIDVDGEARAISGELIKDVWFDGAGLDDKLVVAVWEVCVVGW
jgi:hypothetical protein